MKSKRKKTGKKIGIGILVTIIILVAGFYIYTLDYYRADEHAIEVLLGDDIDSESIESIENIGGIITVYPDETIDLNTGMVFYPGGKVEAIAYLPLLQQLAQQGITCILTPMPLNLAVFDVNAADDVYALYPEIENWYLCGHSLGGAMASNYMNDNSEKVEGLILLGAYPINDADVETLVIYGSEDIQLDLTKLEDLDNVLEIVGGNHAYFGNYGEQEGDGMATMTREEQQKITVEKIMEFINSN